MAYEEPDYDVLVSKDTYELRRYSPYIVAEVDVTGSFRSAGNQAFRLLAGYIFGDNEPQKKMSMTIPVESRSATLSQNSDRSGRIETDAESDQEQQEAVSIEADAASDRTVNRPVLVESRVAIATDANEATYTYAFVMESAYTMESLPRPDNPRIRLVERPGRVMAVNRYSGSTRESKLDKETRALLAALEEDRIEVVGSPVFARYNGPLTPWFMRRNEVMVEVRIDN